MNTTYDEFCKSEAEMDRRITASISPEALAAIRGSYRESTPCEHCGESGAYTDSADDFGPSLFCQGCGAFIR